MQYIFLTTYLNSLLLKVLVKIWFATQMQHLWIFIFLYDQ